MNRPARRPGHGPRVGHACLILGTAAIVACSHADSFVNNVPTVGPYDSGPDVVLTLNAGQDYWPAWSSDGRGILYSFVSADSPTARCLGLLPANGGTRIWQLCDHRTTTVDSTSSFTAYALNDQGILLYTEAIAEAGPTATTPTETRLWLADTATPFLRTSLLTLPVTLNGATYDWLTDLEWTGPSSFIGLAQELTIGADPNPPCLVVRDTLFFTQGIVVQGSLSSGAVTLQSVTGTDGATGYSLAENGGSIVFTRANDLHLYKVPAGGGPAVVVATLPGDGAHQLLGVSCKVSTCLVADDPAVLNNPLGCSGVANGARMLVAVSLATGATQTVDSTADIVVSPKISPVNGDVVIQEGGSLGHLQTIGHPTDANLHLLQGLVP